MHAIVGGTCHSRPPPHAVLILDVCFRAPGSPDDGGRRGGGVQGGRRGAVRTRRRPLKGGQEEEEEAFWRRGRRRRRRRPVASNGSIGGMIPVDGAAGRGLYDLAGATLIV